MNQADQGGEILPPQSAAVSQTALEQAWSPAHLRLHRLLLRQPQLLPAGASLLLALSGGQDSMALLGLLLGLRRLHRWQLTLWHGDHGWRAESAQQAAALADWCRQQGLTLLHERHSPEGTSAKQSEDGARQWRYACLERQALAQGCSHVVSGHTATDRAETLLLHLARGSHRRGLASLRSQRPLGATGVQLSRPLLIFERDETAAICTRLGLPIWLDSSNEALDLSRNRIRLQVLPVLEALHRGATRRLSGTAERLQQELDAEQDWQQLALLWLADGHGGLDRRRLVALQRANQGSALLWWLQRRGITGVSARQLAALLPRLQADQPPGQSDLAGGWRLRWDRSRLELIGP